ncbi:MAG: FHA domain-containing protein [Chloroflexi bacterium]|nr:FHA domain-containing protein [Chloroflexota bacterium]
MRTVRQIPPAAARTGATISTAQAQPSVPTASRVVATRPTASSVAAAAATSPSQSDNATRYLPFVGVAVVLLALGGLALFFIEVRKPRSKIAPVTLARRQAAPQARTVRSNVNRAAETVIGRDPSNGGLCRRSSVSRHHAKISSVAGDFGIEDLHSTNGTRVNGARESRDRSWPTMI